jgi:tRNA U34 5-methylaminomethyl-2-thiouridine-forming methyltransferase MnmC
MTLDIVSTEDGSITCRNPETGELYHNRAGAYTEALRNYVEPCHLKSVIRTKRTLNVLDVCFGLGYNTFVLVLELQKALERIGADHEFRLRVTAIDRDREIVKVLMKVLDDRRLVRLSALAKELEPSALGLADGRDLVEISCLIGKRSPVALELIIQFAELRGVVPRLVREGRAFDFIFHDGFSPRRMPELWTHDLFMQYAQLIGDGGVILTYSSAAAVRGALRECGLTIMRTACVGGKAGGTAAAHTRALADNPFLLPLTDSEEERLNSRSATPYRDPVLSGMREEIATRRQIELSASRLPPFKKS